MRTEKKSILFLTTSIEGGGAEKVFRLIVDYWLDNEIFSGQIVSLRHSNSSTWRKDQIINLGWTSHYDYPRMAIKLSNLLKNKQFDCIFSFTVFANVVAIWARRLAKNNIPIITNARNLTFSLLSFHEKNLRTFLLRKLVRDTYRSADIVLCNSENTAKELIDYYNLDAKRVWTVVNPIDIQETRKFQVPEQKKTSKEIKIMAAARLVEKKGLDILLKAVAKLPDKKNISVLIAGNGPDKIKLQNLAEKLQISEIVRFLGWQPNPLPLIADADIITITSHYEGLPNILLEGMALSKPVIATDCAPIITKIAKKNACIKIPRKSPDHLAEALQRLISNESLRKTIAENSKALIHQFDVPVAIKRYEDAVRLAIVSYEENRSHIWPSVAYVLRRYPTLSETFISSEVRFLHNSGYSVSVLSLLNDDLAIKSSEDKNIPIKRYSYHKLSNWFHLMFQCLKHPYWFARLILFSFNIAMLQPDQAIRLLVLTPKLVSFADYCKCSGITHIHSHFSGLASLAGQTIADLLNISFSFMYHTLVELRSPLFLLHLNRAETILVNSITNKKALQDKWPSLVEGKVRVVRSGLGLKIEKVKSWEKKKDIDILSVGRLVPKKGFDVLIKAIYILQKQDFLVKCRILGDGKERSHYESLIDQYQLKNTKILGSVSNETVYAYMKRAKLFVLPCRKLPDQEDGLPVVITEALANSIPVISCDVGGVKEVVNDNKTGFLVPQNNPEHLAKKMEFLLTNETIRRKLGLNGVELIEREFDKNTILNRLISVFHLENGHISLDETPL